MLVRHIVPFPFSCAISSTTALTLAVLLRWTAAVDSKRRDVGLPVSREIER